MKKRPVKPADAAELRKLFDDYIRMYSSRDEQLTSFFSDDFTGFTGGGDFLVKDKPAWVAITLQDFAQVKAPIRIEIKDVAIQSLAETIAVATGFFVIHLPIKDHVLSRETARLVLIFRKETAGWKISHSSISIPYHLVREGEVYPLKELVDRTHNLEKLVAERTAQLSEANENLQKSNAELAREVTERKLTAEALQASEGRYRSILHASPDDITITDREGRIIMVSPMAFEIFGYAPSDAFYGRPLTDFLVPEDRPLALAQMTRKRQGVATGPSEYRGLRKGGKIFDIEVNSEFIRDAAGAINGMVIIVRDISERKQNEKERARLQEQLLQAQKMESIGRLAGGVAHDFNNLLQVILGNASLTLSDLPPDSPLRESVLEIEKAAKRSAELTRQLLAFARQQAIAPKVLDINEVIDGMLNMLRRLIGEHINLNWIPEPNIWPVNIDPSQLDQILANLCANARDVIGQTGRILIETHNVTLDNAFTALNPDGHPGDYVLLSVSDNGHGMDAETLANIFEPFFTTKEPGKGTGLGLATVFGIVKQNKGLINVDSQPDQGTTFKIYFPRDSSTVVREPETAPIIKAGTGTILLVEDEESILNLGQRILSKSGYQVLTSSSPEAARELVALYRGPIDLLVTDVVMPGTNGRELRDQLKASRPEMKCLFMSGYTADIIAHHGVLDSDVEFIQKPFTIQTLTEKIRAVMVKK